MSLQICTFGSMQVHWGDQSLLPGFYCAVLSLKNLLCHQYQSTRMKKKSIIFKLHEVVATYSVILLDIRMKSLKFTPYHKDMKPRGCNVIQMTSSLFLVNPGTNWTWVFFQRRRWAVRTARIGNFLPDDCSSRTVEPGCSSPMPWLLCLHSYSYGFQMLSPVGKK